MKADDWKRWMHAWMHPNDQWIQRANAILRLLVESPEPPNKYSICKQLKHMGSWPTLFYTVDDLERQGLIEPVKILDNTRGGKSKLYGITRLGLAFLLSMLEPKVEDYKLLDQAADRCQKVLPETLSVWRALVEANLHEGAVRVLAMLAPLIPNYLALPTTRESPLLDEWLADLMLGIPNEVISEVGRAWLRMLRDNPRLREAAARTAKRRVDSAVKQANEVLRCLGVRELEVNQKRPNGHW